MERGRDDKTKLTEVQGDVKTLKDQIDDMKKVKQKTKDKRKAFVF